MNKKVIEKLAGALNLKAEELAQVLTSEEEVEFNLPEGDFYSKSDIETLKDNHGKERYDAGKTAGYEISFKELSKASGIETVKSGEDFIKSYKSRVLEEAKIEPEKKVKELSESMEKLQKQLESKDKEIQDIQSSVKQKETRYEIQSMIPDIPETLGLSKKEAADLFFMNFEVKEDGIYKGDQLLKDNLERPISKEQAINNFVSERGWNKPVSGRGGGANAGNTKTPIRTFDDYEKELKEKGYHPGSAEANALLSEIAKENPEILN